MASRMVDVIIGLTNKFTGPMNQVIQSMERSQKQSYRLGREIEKTGQKISNVGSSMSKGFTLPIIGAGIASFKMASDVEESINKVDIAFGKNANEIKKWSKATLENYGIAQGTALDMVANFGDMGTGMGLTTKKAANMAKGLTGLAGDLASFKNIKIDVAKTALNGVFTGETESLKQLGIVMTQANLDEYARAEGMKKTVKQMNQQEQTMLRYNFILSKTKNAQGDFARTGNGAANQQRVFTEGAKELSANLGTHLLPMGTRIIAKGNELIKKFGGLNKESQATILKIAGVTAAIGPCIFVIGKMTAGIGRLIKNTKQVVKVLKLFRLANIKSRIEIIKNRIETIKLTAAKIKDRVATVAHTAASKLCTAGTWAMTAAQKALRWAFVATPFGWVALAIGAVVTAGVVLYKNWDKIRKAATSLAKGIKSAFSGLGEWFSGIGETIKAGFKGVINFIVGGVNKIPEGINSLKLTVPKWVPVMGGKTLSFNLPKIPYLAKGTKNWGGGPAVINEKGGEIVDLPKGSRVYPHDKSVKMGRELNIVINKLADKIEVRDDKDIDSIAEKLGEVLFRKIQNMGVA